MTWIRSKRIVAMHVLLALAAIPMLCSLVYLLEEASTAVLVAVAAVYAAIYAGAPVLGYLFVLRGHRYPFPVEEAAVRTGTLWGFHWFEFESLPHECLWTRDAEKARRIRERQHELPVGGHTVSFKNALLPSPRRHLHAFMETMVSVSACIFIPYALTGVGIAVLGGTESTLEPGVAVILWVYLAIVALIPTLTGFWLVHGTLLGFGWFAWNGWIGRKRSNHVEWSGPVLRSEKGAIDLDAPNTTVSLHHEAQGTCLTVENDETVQHLRGDWRYLQPLAAAIAARSTSTEDERKEARAALEPLVRQHA